VTLHTIGHGARSGDDLARLLGDAGINLVVDIRAHPGSRRHPQFGRAELERWLPEAGISYRWEPALGGRRSGRAGSRHMSLRVPAFRAYADYMETPEFDAALDVVLAESDERATTVMCAESLWWRCHRRLAADAAVLLRNRRVLHLLPDGRSSEHPPMEVARVVDGVLVYDAGGERLPGTDPD
jgi:uncharacterized protein (DUF488 family)